MDMFQNICRFYADQAFVDLTLVAGLDNSHVGCHVMVLVAAVPGLHAILRDHCCGHDDTLTLLFPELDGASLANVVSNIYDALVQKRQVTQSQKDQWAATLGVDRPYNQARPPKRSSRRLDADCVEGGISRIRKRPKQKNSTNKTAALEVLDLDSCYPAEPVSDQAEDIQEGYDDGDEDDDIDDGGQCEESGEVDQFVYLSDEEDKRPQPHCPSDRPPDKNFLEQFLLDHYDTEPPEAGEDLCDSLDELCAAILNADSGSDCVFQATTAGVYLKDSLQIGDSCGIPAVPPAPFVALFSVGVRAGRNLVKPVSLLHEHYPANLVVQQFLVMIQHLLGLSTGSLLEAHCQKWYTDVDRETREKELQAQFKALSDEERRQLILNNDDDQTVLTHLLNSPLPEKAHSLKFKLTKDLDAESIIDYVLVQGGNISELRVQSYLRPARSKSGVIAQSSFLVDAMAAFCRLQSAYQLNSVPHFKDLMERHFDRMCERAALKSVCKSQKSGGGRRRTATCPDCKQLFSMCCESDRKKFECHKLSHVGCQCDLTFESDAQYRAHMKSVHLQKKKFKCVKTDCLQVFSSKKTLSRHVRMVHDRFVEGGGSGVVCDVCGQAYMNKHFLNRHISLHHSEIECKNCQEKVSGGATGMYYHAAYKCVKPTRFLCPHCGQEFKIRSSYRTHIKTVHMAEEDKLDCTHCHKTFATRSRLAIHMKGVHSNEKLFLCRSEACSVRFSCDSTRRRHELKQHNLDIRLKRGNPSRSTLMKQPTAGHDLRCSSAS